MFGNLFTTYYDTDPPPIITEDYKDKIEPDKDLISYLKENRKTELLSTYLLYDKTNEKSSLFINFSNFFIQAVDSYTLRMSSHSNLSLQVSPRMTKQSLHRVMLSSA